MSNNFIFLNFLLPKNYFFNIQGNEKLIFQNLLLEKKISRLLNYHHLKKNMFILIKKRLVRIKKILINNF